MEFHEKLQQLRKQHRLTQEQLAERLFVSRTAISKWESGRGYPNLESLKCLSKLFSVSIDHLLSNEELMELAETENRSNLNRTFGAVFGALDVIAVTLLFLPLFGQQTGDVVFAVCLFSYTGVTETLRILYLIALSLLSLFGVFELIAAVSDCGKRRKNRQIGSVALSAAVILLFAVSRQAYMTVLLFVLFMIKIVLILQEKRI